MAAGHTAKKEAKKCNAMMQLSGKLFYQCCGMYVVQPINVSEDKVNLFTNWQI